MKLAFLLLNFIAVLAFADTPPPGTVKIKGATDGTNIGNVSDALKVNVVNGSSSSTVNQGNPNAGGVLSWFVQGSLGRTWNLTSGSDSVASVQSGSWSTGRTWTLLNSTDSVNVGNFPSFALDSTLQTTNTKLTTINTTLGSPFQAGGSIGNTSFGVTQVTSPWVTSVTSSKAPVNLNGSGTSSTVSTVQSLTAPSNAVGFVLMNLDSSTANIRWSVGRTATTTVGQQLQPGRSSDFVPVGASVSVVAESGTQGFDIQWVSQ